MYLAYFFLSTTTVYNDDEYDSHDDNKNNESKQHGICYDHNVSQDTLQYKKIYVKFKFS